MKAKTAWDSKEWQGEDASTRLGNGRRKEWMRVKRRSLGPEDEHRGDSTHGEDPAEEAPCDQAAARPRTLRDPELAHERRALKRWLGVTPLGGLDERVQEQEGADEPEQREH
jgi:hypothetical protein